ncbi:translation initiation factor IF-2 [Candidatus Peregrinibacteria bacterium]|nr:translation initiation factor IF-2 [Candidatus Peregrinibacteria bacterium]
MAKALGMTGQELRKELLTVNFGVKPTDREVPEALAKGIIRFIAQRKGLTIDIDSLGFSLDDEDTETVEKNAEQAEAATDVKAPEPVKAAPTATTPESLNVLRKLSLDDVSKEAIQKQQQQLRMTKAQREAQRQEERVQRAVAAKKPQTMQEQIKKKEGLVMLPDQISVKELAEKTGIQVPQIIQTLMKNGVMATITQSIDYDTAAIVATELGIEVKREERSAKAEDLLSRNLKELLKDEPEHLKPRPPIVVVMGHVDHGKTAILDAIRETDVVKHEAGGITQHIGAYQVEHVLQSGGKEERHRITFLDTPGHEAFTAMRARGAQVTDIAIIVVSAEEGVKPTTIEAINHAKDAGVPIIVAINKIDKERADPDRVKGELAGQGLQPEEWGGTVPFVLCSAVTKQGISDLLDHIVLLSELHGFKANPNRSAVATVIESHLDSSHGPLVTVIVNAGTLRVGDPFVCGSMSGKVKAMMDAHGVRINDVGPSGAARMSGLSDVPTVGDIVQVVSSERDARSLLDVIRAREAEKPKRSFADLVSRLTEGKLTQLKIVLKADAQGSLEAIQHALGKMETQGVSPKVIHAAVGAVSDSDVQMAAASDGVVLSFNAAVSPDVQRTAEREGVQIREYNIVYELLDEVDRLLKGLIEPEIEENVFGHLEVRGVFLTKKSEQIIGGKVTDGVVKRVQFRLMRDGKEIGAGRITSLKHVDKDIKEAKEGQECGMRVETTAPILEGDILEVFSRELRRKEA